MKRSDLKVVGFNGWQVVDATPQEMSNDVFRTGPAPVIAIKRGQSVSYDCDFVIGEVSCLTRRQASCKTGLKLKARGKKKEVTRCKISLGQQV